MGLLEKIQARIELRRLEQRYVARKNRNTWMSDAVYVDGEYVFPSKMSPPSPTASSSSQPSSSSTSSSHKSSWSWASKGPNTRFKEFRERIRI